MIVVLQTLVFFRESFLAALDRILRPYYKHFSLTFNAKSNVSEDDESEDHVFAEFDDEKGVTFYPPVYSQRYAAVSDCIMDERWCGKIEKVVDFGYHDMSFIKYLKEVPGIKKILGVDIESMPLRCSSDLLRCDDFIPKRETPLCVSLYKGNAADPDYRLIGCDAVIAIEMIEHMLPHDLEKLVHTIFGFIKPWIAIITTPNGDFNPLFKALEKNGLRRLDHFFEWSREQFHDWCSNIVTRYPYYTVSCRGVGPGPPGTIHYGSCSQLALFVAKNYHKQQDLNLNSLAMVAKAPSDSVCNILETIDGPDIINESNMLCNNMESYTEFVFSNNQSCVTIVLPNFSFESLEYHDKTSQCNLDKEIGKNFLMFDEEQCYKIVIPRRKVNSNRVYVIEDVNCRLNCTTLQVKRFSKKTQNMMAKHKIESLVHTREVVDEIRHLTKMLNFGNEFRDPADGDHVWHNINWGDNAPYWNQYYKVVKEYNYPFETKSEECRIMDLISEEINRQVDMQFDDDVSVDMNKLEIPIDQLMSVVQHITDDVDRVKDLLEWNGYEVSGDVVVHSRLAVDTLSMGSREDWRDNETYSDWDTEVRSTSLSDGSMVVPDSHGRNLYRALDQKVRKLRSMVSNNEDITTELDRVTCRLMKLALRTTRRSQRPLTNRWMQCKLLDLLTLTEKAIERKRQLFPQINPLKAICYDEPQVKPEYVLSNILKDDTANEIVNKYRHLVRSSENMITSDDSQNLFFDDLESKLAKDNFIEDTSSELEYQALVRSPSLIDIDPMTAIPTHARKQYFNSNDTLNPVLERTQAWVDEDVNIMRQNSALGISSGDTDHSAGNIARYKNKNNNKKQKKITKDGDDVIDLKHYRKHQSKTPHKKRNKIKNDDNHKSKDKTSTTRMIKKAVKKKSSYNILIKTCSKNISTANFGSCVLKAKKSIKQHTLQTSSSRPISETLMELCNLDINIDRKKCDVTLGDIINDSVAVSENNSYVNNSIAITKESLLIDIIMEDKEETIALRRTVGTDAEDDSVIFDQENVLGSMTNIMKIDSFSKKPDMGFEHVQSQSLFIYDINEPSTSKGVRHVSMDVQCGPDTINKYAMLSATTSLTKMPKLFNTGIRIGNSTSDVQDNVRNCDFSTSTNENVDSYKTLTPRERCVGVKIKSSETTIAEKIESGTMTHKMKTTQIAPSIPNSSNSATETKMLKPISSRLKIEDSGSEFSESVSSSRRSPFHFTNFSKDTSDFQMKLSISKDIVVERNFSCKYVRPKLVNGGVYVHSYKDRLVNEDVVYQGEWQKHTPSTKAKKREFNVVASKKDFEGANKKVRASSKDTLNASKIVKSKPIKRTPTCNLKNLKQERKNNGEIEPIKRNSKSNLKATKNYRNTNKVASKLTASSVPSKSNNKSSYVTKKPSVTFNIGKKDNESVSRPKQKSYIPLYLQRKLSKNNHHIISLQSDSKRKVTADNVKPINNNIGRIGLTTKDIKENLLKFDRKPRGNLSYVIFRNEIEANNNSSTDFENPLNKNSGNDKRPDDSNRSLSPQSLNSSSGSSPHSIATVRLRTTSKSPTDRRYSTSSNKSNLVIRQTENALVKSKRSPKRYKSTKKAQDKVYDNKENLPETSRKSKDSGKTNKSVFLKNKNIFRAQIATDNSQSTNKVTMKKSQTPNKSNIKRLSIPSSTDKQPASVTSSKPSLTKQRSLKSRTSSFDNKSEKDSDNSDVVVTPTLEKQNTPRSSEIQENSVIINIVDHNLLTEWINTTNSNEADRHTSGILTSMRQLVEERLDFIENMSDNSAEMDTKTIVLSETFDCIPFSETTSYHDATSLNSSYGTVVELNEYDFSQIMELDPSFLDSVVYNEFDPIMDEDSTISMTDNKPNITDLEQLSFKSITSASKMSEYFLAESSLNNVPDAQNTDMPSTNSVHDIFERKTPLTMQNPTGTLAVQAFSGFSMNEPIVGDQPDHVNLIDSETGSVAFENARQANSEEVFISGRSSDSYQSCQVDDDTVVPNWLFQIISQQQSLQEEVEDEEEDESDDLAPMQLPVVQPMFDVNGNVVEPGMGAGAGAGDGRGIHSDHSQDSSGRGTSLSSSATSSGPQSEAIIIDPAVFTAQYDLMREPIGSTSHLLPTSAEVADTSHATAESSVNFRNAELLNSSGDPQRAPAQAASDVDADVSSMDTDVLDSSSN